MMWSMQDLPFLKPACSWGRIPSTAVVMRWRMMRLKILLVRDSRVMPRQLLQFPRSPFLGSLTMEPVFHSLGASSLFQIF
ncbi:hypothetical protein DPMN_123301 [Dreissena polymorpha]|uniref:Uncharacterized protein n=1 Tax=Dreissena polymorpha TaxID=45954 RepID=A0A9D4GX64_DREPO|nr:hypothetical protein DPMN_123159 [Dreissena polymorpha]KAH3821537.1 hypothetical protein DPMN_123301 [Dreissena polymorpha]